MLNDTPTSAMTLLRPTIKGQKVGHGPIPGNPCPFPQIIEILLPSLTCEISQPIKTSHAVFWGSLSPSEMAYTLPGECVSLWINPVLTYHFISKFFCNKARTLNVLIKGLGLKRPWKWSLHRHKESWKVEMMKAIEKAKLSIHFR